MEGSRGERYFKGPVRWLLGPQLLASLKYVALYTVTKGKLDLRNWMRPDVVTFDIEARLNKDTSANEFWFDYFADCGDGMKAMYSIAYLCMRDNLFTEETPVPGQSRVGFEKLGGQTIRLPRGEFLFIGGDTSYHMADYETLANRFQTPFLWAFEDLERDGAVDQTRRPLFGIPGNHDYYDLLDGFGRQFLRPTDPEGPDGDGPVAQLSIKGFERRQTASYIALKLPFDWSMWGIDDEIGDQRTCVDARQLEFFEALGKPDKLIVATPEPTTVLGQKASEGKTVTAFRSLGLDLAFLDGKLDDRKCRLDLSGDTHHYARYWGSPTGQEAPSAPNYASVVSGAGGAFLHPSHVDLNQVQEQALYPSARDSCREVAKRLMNPFVVIGGGYVALFGGLLAAVIYFAATMPATSRPVVDSILSRWLGVPALAVDPSLGLLPQIQPPVSVVPGGSLRQVVYLVLSVVLVGASIGFFRKLVSSLPDRLAGAAQGEQGSMRSLKIKAAISVVGALVFLSLAMIHFVKHRDSVSPFGSSVLILFCLLWSLSALVASFLYAELLSKRAIRRSIGRADYLPVWALAAIAAAVFWGGCLSFGRYPAIYVMLDILFASLVLLAGVGLVLVAALVGGRLHGAAGRIGFGLLGVWHAVLQLAVPLLLVRAGSWRDWVLAPLVALAVAPLGYLLAKDRRTRWLLALLWIAYGLLMLSLPWIVGGAAGEMPAWVGRCMEGVGLGLHLHYPRLLVAGGLGALLSCVWLGWYFAISLAFNGHEEEAGGAARLERYKEFIRIRLTPDTLTAYVIAIDDPRSNGRDLRAKIVDLFELKASPR